MTFPINAFCRLVQLSHNPATAHVFTHCMVAGSRTIIPEAYGCVDICSCNPAVIPWQVQDSLVAGLEHYCLQENQSALPKKPIISLNNAFFFYCGFTYVFVCMCVFILTFLLSPQASAVDR